MTSRWDPSPFRNHFPFIDYSDKGHHSRAHIWNKAPPIPVRIIDFSWTESLLNSFTFGACQLRSWTKWAHNSLSKRGSTVSLLLESLSRLGSSLHTFRFWRLSKQPCIFTSITLVNRKSYLHVSMLKKTSVCTVKCFEHWAICLQIWHEGNTATIHAYTRSKK